MKITVHALEQARRLGLVERSDDGVERIRISLHLRTPVASSSYAALSQTMRDWESDVRAKLMGYGAKVIGDTLSVTGQSVEVMAPVAQLNPISDWMAAHGVDTDLVRSEIATY